MTITANAIVVDECTEMRRHCINDIRRKIEAEKWPEFSAKLLYLRDMIAKKEIEMTKIHTDFDKLFDGQTNEERLKEFDQDVAYIQRLFANDKSYGVMIDAITKFTTKYGIIINSSGAYEFGGSF